MSIKGRQFTGSLSRLLDSLREQFLYVTVGKTGSGRVSLDTVARKYYEVTASVAVELGSDNRNVKITGHSVKEGDMIRFVSTSNTIIEEEVLVDEVIDADNFYLASVLSANLTAGDTISIYRPTFERVASDGSSLATVVAPPLQIGVEGVATAVNDSATPANVVAVPVKIMAADGTNITVNAGDINVQLSHSATNYDSTRIGDGTNLLGVNANNEAKVHDADVLAELGNVTAAVTGVATEVTLNAVKTAVEAINTKVATEATLSSIDTKVATETTLNAVKTAVELMDDTIAIDGGPALSKFQTVGGHTGTTSHAWYVDASGLGRVDVRASALPTGASTSALQTSANAILTDIETNTENTNTNVVELVANVGDVTDTAAGSDTGNFSILAFIKRGMQNWTTLLGVLPSSIGQKAKADSLSVTLASDQGAVPVNQSAMTPTSSDVTVNTSAGTATAPVGAKWCKIYASKNNTDDVVVRMGGTATTTVGTILEPARSEDFMVAGDVSHISVSGTQKIHITWGA